jgi:hypothetical protein
MTDEEQVSRALVEDQTIVMSSTLSAGPTRTVAIIKNHALESRFDIESRITEAGFEVTPLSHNHTTLVPFLSPDSSPCIRLCLADISCSCRLLRKDKWKLMWRPIPIPW